MSSAAPRKPKAKVRALKDHKPTMRIDVAEAERLAREIRNQGMVLFRLYNDFRDVINGPFNYVAVNSRADEGKDGYEFAKAINYFLQKESNALMLNSERAEKAIEAAVTALRLFKSQQQPRTAVGAEAQA